MNHTEASLAQRRANAKKMYTKKRQTKACQRGHKNWGYRKDGRRYCITCKVYRNREWRKNYKPRRPIMTKRNTELIITKRLTFEERQILHQKVSVIQQEREYRVRRMWVSTTNGERLSLGGGARPESQQIKSGYPSQVPNYQKRAA